MNIAGRNMQKKSQATIFMIIVLVLIMATGLTYFAISSRTIEETAKQIALQQVSAQKIAPVRDYITSCLSLASSEGLSLIGKQGGYIYTSQGGFIEDPLPEHAGSTYAPYLNSIARYGITRPESDVGNLFFASAPDYPWPAFPNFYNPLTGNSTVKMDGYYGRNKVPPFNASLANSIPEQLEKYAEFQFAKCIRWDAFSQQGLNITAGTPDITIIFAESDMTFRLKWDVLIKEPATGSSTELHDFAAVHPVRLKKILDFARLINDADSTNITYDIQASDGLTSSFRTSDAYGFDDLIIIRDAESSILDQQYEFMYFRQNRAPALFYIPEITERICNGSFIEKTGSNKVMVTDSCGENSYEILLEAVDPDEDEINFTFSPSLPHEITEYEGTLRELKLKISATDSQYEDWQELSIPTRRE